MSQNDPWSSGQGFDNVNIQLLSFLCNFVTKSVCPTPIKMPLCGLWSMGLTEGVIQRVDMSLSTNKLACVLASIIGVPCNVPLPRAVLCVPMAILNEGSQGFNGTPVSFKQTQGDPLLFSMLHWTAGSPQASRLGAGIPHRGPRPSAHSPIVPLMTSSQESGVNSLFTLLADTSLFYFSVAWLWSGVRPQEKQRGSLSCSTGTWLAVGGERLATIYSPWLQNEIVKQIETDIRSCIFASILDDLIYHQPHLVIMCVFLYCTFRACIQICVTV